MEGRYHGSSRAVCDYVTLQLIIQDHWQLNSMLPNDGCGSKCEKLNVANRVRYARLSRPHPRISSPDFGSSRPTQSRSSLHHLSLTSRDFVPWRFLDAGQLSVRSLFLAGVQKPAHFRTSPSPSPGWSISWRRCAGAAARPSPRRRRRGGQEAWASRIDPSVGRAQTDRMRPQIFPRPIAADPKHLTGC
jgi:hypothetical protein